MPWVCNPSWVKGLIWVYSVIASGGDSGHVFLLVKIQMSWLLSFPYHLDPKVWHLLWCGQQSQRECERQSFKDWRQKNNSTCNPLQCSCLENPRGGGARWAAIYGVARSRTRLKWLSSSSSKKPMKSACLGLNPASDIYYLRFCSHLTQCLSLLLVTPYKKVLSMWPGPYYRINNHW